MRAFQVTQKAAEHLACAVDVAWQGISRYVLRRPKQVGLRVTEGAFPVQLKSNILYILTEDGAPWQAAMICPCGCGTTLDMNLLPDERPRWRFCADSRGGATLHPSVWRKIGCKSHFWIKRGRIIWC